MSLRVTPSRVHGIREWVIVFYRNLPHVMNVRTLKRAMRDRQIAGDFDTVDVLAERIDASRSTVSRFFAGKNTSLAITLKILQALRVTFDEVFIEISPALLARLQTEGIVYEDRGVTVVSADMLTWPEANDIRAHFGLTALPTNLAQRALPDRT